MKDDAMCTYDLRPQIKLQRAVVKWLLHRKCIAKL